MSESSRRERHATRGAMRRQRRKSVAVAPARMATVNGVGWWSPPPPSNVLASDGAMTGCGANGPCGVLRPCSGVPVAAPTRWRGYDVVKRNGSSAAVGGAGALGVAWYRRVGSVVACPDAVPRVRSIVAATSTDPAAGAAGPDSGPVVTATAGVDGTGAGGADGGWP